jgi:hypothetical protein
MYCVWIWVVPMFMLKCLFHKWSQCHEIKYSKVDFYFYPFLIWNSLWMDSAHPHKHFRRRWKISSVHAIMLLIVPAEHLLGTNFIANHLKTNLLHDIMVAINFERINWWLCWLLKMCLICRRKMTGKCFLFRIRWY